MSAKKMFKLNMAHRSDKQNNFSKTLYEIHSF